MDIFDIYKSNLKAAQARSMPEIICKLNDSFDLYMDLSESVRKTVRDTLIAKPNSHDGDMADHICGCLIAGTLDNLNANLKKYSGTVEVALSKDVNIEMRRLDQMIQEADPDIRLVLLAFVRGGTQIQNAVMNDARSACGKKDDEVLLEYLIKTRKEGNLGNVLIYIEHANDNPFVEE